MDGYGIYYVFIYIHIHAHTNSRNHTQAFSADNSNFCKKSCTSVTTIYVLGTALCTCVCDTPFADGMGSFQPRISAAGLMMKSMPSNTCALSACQQSRGSRDLPLSI